MAIAKQQVTPTINADPKTVQDAYDTITTNPVDPSVVCISKDLEGTPLETTYYAQRLGRDDAFRFQDNTLSPSYQTYIKISGLVLNVIEAPDFDIDSETGIATGNGVALVSQYMKFNPGDAFYADAINNEMTLFRVESVELTSVHRGSPFRITYSLVGPVTESSSEIVDLNTKTYQTLYYDEKFVTSCSGPLLSEEEVATLEEVGNAYDALLREYIRIFADPDTDAILLTDGDRKIYDPFLNKMMVRTIPPEYHVRRSLRGFNTNDLNAYTIFDYVMEPHLMDYSTPLKEVKVNSKLEYGGQRSSMFLYFSAVDYFIDSEGTGVLTDIVDFTPYTGTIDIDGILTPLVPDISDTTYVVSPEFYDGTYTSLLEIELAKVLSREKLDTNNLLTLAKSFKNWSLYEQFYFGALLVTMLRVGGSTSC